MRFRLMIMMLLVSVLSQAQDIRNLFVAMPDSVCPLLTEVNRADFGDFLDSGMKAVVKNRFGKNSEMKVMTKDYILLNLTSVDEWEMKLLPVNDSVSVVCVVKTFVAPAHDSSIEFYDSQWKRLDSNAFVQLPDEADFFKSGLQPEQQDSLQALQQSVGMSFVRMSLDPHSCLLKFHCTSAEYMSKEEKKKFPEFLGKEVVYEWTDGKFIRKRAEM